MPERPAGMPEFETGSLYSSVDPEWCCLYAARFMRDVTHTHISTIYHLQTYLDKITFYTRHESIVVSHHQHHHHHRGFLCLCDSIFYALLHTFYIHIKIGLGQSLGTTCAKRTNVSPPVTPKQPPHNVALIWKSGGNVELGTRCAAAHGLLDGITAHSRGCGGDGASDL